ncbi:MAG: hypothetical protein AAB625_03060 [Patescibacteria group bacterium]
MVIANLLGVFLFFFFLWKRLKDDYHYEKVFNLAVIILIGLSLGFFTSLKFFSDYWFWLEIVGVALGFTFVIKNQKIKFIESFEGLIIGLLPWLGLYYLANAILTYNLISFLYFWLVSVSVFLFFFFDTQYKKFTWYKSGRVGFSGIATLAIFFVLRAGLFYNNTVELILSSVAALLLIILLYNLSRNND